MQENQKIDYTNKFQSIPQDHIKILGLDIDNMAMLGFITENGFGNCASFNVEKQCFLDYKGNETEKTKLITEIWKQNNAELESQKDHPLINLIVDSFLSQRANGIENLQIYVNSIAFAQVESDIVQAIINPIINKAREKFKKITGENSLPSCDLIVPTQGLNIRKDDSELRILSYMDNQVGGKTDDHTVGDLRQNAKNAIGSNVIEYIKTKSGFNDKQIASILVDNDPEHYQQFVQYKEGNATYYAMPMTRLLHAEVVYRDITSKNPDGSDNITKNVPHQIFEGKELITQNFDPNTVLYNTKGELSDYGAELNEYFGVNRRGYLGVIGGKQPTKSINKPKLIKKEELFKILDKYHKGNTGFFGGKNRKNWEEKDGLKALLEAQGMTQDKNAKGNQNNGIWTIKADNNGEEKTYFVKFVGNNGHKKYADSNRHYKNTDTQNIKKKKRDEGDGNLGIRKTANNISKRSSEVYDEDFGNTTADMHVQNLFAKTFTAQNPLKLENNEDIVISELHKYTTNDGKVMISEGVEGVFKDYHMNPYGLFHIYKAEIIIDDIHADNFAKQGNTYNLFDLMISTKFNLIKVQDDKLMIGEYGQSGDIEKEYDTENKELIPKTRELSALELENLKRITSWEFVKTAYYYFKDRNPKDHTLLYLNSYFKLLSDARDKLEKTGHFDKHDDMQFPKSLEELKRLNKNELEKYASEDKEKYSAPEVSSEINIEIISEHSNEENNEEYDPFNRENTESEIFKPGSGSKPNGVNTPRIIGAGGGGNNNDLNKKYQPPLSKIEERASEYNPSNIIKKASNITGKFPSNINHSNIIFAPEGNIAVIEGGDVVNTESRREESSQVSHKPHHDECAMVIVNPDENKQKLANFSNDLDKYIKNYGSYNALKIDESSNKIVNFFKHCINGIKYFLNAFLRRGVLHEEASAVDSNTTADDLRIKIKSQLLEIHCLKNGLGKDEIDSNINDIEFKSRTIEDLMTTCDINKKDLDIEVRDKKIKSNIVDCYEVDAGKKIGVKCGEYSYVPYSIDNEGKNTKKLDDRCIIMPKEGDDIKKSPYSLL
jgi:hypothetical protein